MRCCPTLSAPGSIGPIQRRWVARPYTVVPTFGDHARASFGGAARHDRAVGGVVVADPFAGMTAIPGPSSPSTPRVKSTNVRRRPRVTATALGSTVGRGRRPRSSRRLRARFSKAAVTNRVSWLDKPTDEEATGTPLAPTAPRRVSDHGTSKGGGGLTRYRDWLRR